MFLEDRITVLIPATLKSIPAVHQATHLPAVLPVRAVQVTAVAGVMRPGEEIKK
jgi:hypothetical protein